LSSRGQVVTRTRLIPAEARRNHAVLPFAAGLFTAAFLTMAVWAFTPPARSIRDTAKATVVQRTAASEAALRFDQFFKLAPTSPRGTAVAEVSPAQSFELADRHLQSGAPEERLEAEFWLKRGLAMTLAGGTNSWALTQLGTLLVDQSTRTPDYDRARVLWELAASQGDTVAMCFLGTLYEQGLGVAASKSTALNYFSQSKASGGCRGVDAAIARLKE
jgi:TPR repeat protein